MNKAILVFTCLIFGFLENPTTVLGEGSTTQIDSITKAETTWRDSGDYKNAYLSLRHKNELSERSSSSFGTSPLKVALLVLIPVILVFSFLVFILYRTKREAHFREVKRTLDLEVSEMGMKALRAQINPHFIFNCLSSMIALMQANELKLAEEYLMKFSKLLRTILENSAHREVSISEDLLALELYIQLEQIQSNSSFNYRIDLDESINPDEVFIPPLILQPFIENSIKHGFSSKPDGALIRIHIKKLDTSLSIILTDNGKAPDLQPSIPNSQLEKRTSMGLDITKQRLELWGQINNNKPTLTLLDMKDEDGTYLGKKVELLLPLVTEE